MRKYQENLFFSLAPTFLIVFACVKKNHFPVLVINITISMCSSIGGGADYGLWDYGFVRIADCARASGGHGLQDYGLF